MTPLSYTRKQKYTANRRNAVLQKIDYLLAFLTEYNKVYSRRYRADGKLPEELSGKDMFPGKFSKWAKMARQARSDYLDEKITGEEMLVKIKLE